MNLLFNETGFSLLGPNLPPKDCGPFHPDYAIMWDCGTEEIYLMICYTCGEAKLLTKDRVDTYAINAYKMESFANVLAEFKVNGPW
jgi:hypothetical protein